MFGSCRKSATSPSLSLQSTSPHSVTSKANVPLFFQSYSRTPDEAYPAQTAYALRYL